MPRLDRNAKWRELTLRRVNALFNQLRLIENIMNKSNYTFSKSEAKEVHKAINKRVKITLEKLREFEATTEAPFSFQNEEREVE